MYTNRDFNEVLERIEKNKKLLTPKQKAEPFIERGYTYLGIFTGDMSKRYNKKLIYACKDCGYNTFIHMKNVEEIDVCLRCSGTDFGPIPITEANKLNNAIVEARTGKKSKANPYVFEETVPSANEPDEDVEEIDDDTDKMIRHYSGDLFNPENIWEDITEEDKNNIHSRFKTACENGGPHTLFELYSENILLHLSITKDGRPVEFAFYSLEGKIYLLKNCKLSRYLVYAHSKDVEIIGSQSEMNRYTISKLASSLEDK